MVTGGSALAVSRHVRARHLVEASMDRVAGPPRHGSYGLAYLLLNDYKQRAGPHAVAGVNRGPLLHRVGAPARVTDGVALWP